MADGPPAASMASAFTSLLGDSLLRKSKTQAEATSHSHNTNQWSRYLLDICQLELELLG
jgi:hypothetical protein